MKVRVEASDALGAFEEALLETRNRGYSPRLAVIGSNVFFGLLHQLWRMGQLGVVPEKISNCPIRSVRAERLEQPAFAHTLQLRIPEAWHSRIQSYFLDSDEEAGERRRERTPGSK